MSLVHRRRVMNAERIDRALRRIAAEIMEYCPDPARLALIGVRAGGVNATLRLAEILQQGEGLKLPVGMLDPTLYRDDLADGRMPVLKKSEIDFDLEGKYVVLIDDVLFTGRTIRAAMEGLLAFGRPAVIRAAVLVDRREHRELPIQPDYWGQIIDTAADEKIDVSVGATRSRTDRVEVVTIVTNAEDGQ